jgi:hypothetical protein
LPVNLGDSDGLATFAPLPHITSHRLTFAVPFPKVVHFLEDSLERVLLANLRILPAFLFLVAAPPRRAFASLREIFLFIGSLAQGHKGPPTHLNPRISLRKRGF